MTKRDYDDIVGVTVFCDRCGGESRGDYKVPAGKDSLDVARDYLATQNWYITETQDLCPKCAPDLPVHVVPVGDLIEHDTSGGKDDCMCIPTVDPVKRDDGSMGWLIVHHSLDGRELQEQHAARQAERGRWAWEAFAAVRKAQWCHCEFPQSMPHPWLPDDHPLWPSGHQRVPPSLNWELHQFQDDARFAGIIPKPAGGEPNHPGMWRP